MIEIELTKPKKIILVREVSCEADTVKVNHVIDTGSIVEAEIVLSIGEQSQVQTWTLWQGEDYVKIGNWTDEDVKYRLLELIK